jgi:hypothetical protein
MLQVLAVKQKCFKAKGLLKDGWPTFTQRIANAATTRSMAYLLYDVCRRHATTDTGKMRAAMLASFVKADLVCRSAGRHFTTVEHEEFASAIQDALVLNNALAARALALEKKLYKMLPKHHAMTHVAYDSMTNPRRNHCYQDEDMTGSDLSSNNGCPFELPKPRGLVFGKKNRPEGPECCVI